MFSEYPRVVCIAQFDKIFSLFVYLLLPANNLFAYWKWLQPKRFSWVSENALSLFFLKKAGLDAVVTTFIILTTREQNAYPLDWIHFRPSLALSTFMLLLPVGGGAFISTQNPCFLQQLIARAYDF